jgi:Domain of unknown function (DUF4340)
MSGAAAVQRRKIVMWMGGIAAAAILVGGLTFVPPSEEQKRAEVGRLVLPEFAANAEKVALVMVTTKDEAYHIVRNGSGPTTQWVLAEKGSYPVEPERVAKLLRAVAAIKFEQPKTRDDKKFDRIGLGDPAEGGTGAVLEVSDGQGNNFAKLLVGYREGRSYIREIGDLQAWAVDGGEMPPLQRAARWLDLDVATIAPADIQEVTVRAHDGPWYTLLAADAAGQQFKLAQPHSSKRLITTFGPTLTAQALSRFSPIDVQPAAKVARGAPWSQYIVQSRSGASIVVQTWKPGGGKQGEAKGGLWVTISAAIGEKATAEAAVAASRINARAGGWAFGLTELDWNTFSTPLAALVE